MPSSVTATLAPMVGAGRAETTLDDLLEAVRSYTPADDLPAAERLICKATALAERAHEGQFRLTGEPFVQHPMSVARMLTTCISIPTPSRLRCYTTAWKTPTLISERSDPGSAPTLRSWWTA